MAVDADLRSQGLCYGWEQNSLDVGASLDVVSTPLPSSQLRSPTPETGRIEGSSGVHETKRFKATRCRP